MRSSEAEGYGPAPEGTTISAIVGDTVCATTTIGAPRYGETRYRLSVEEGCGGAEEGVEVKLRAELKTLDPGWALWQHAKTVYWARSETVDILMQARPPTAAPTPHATFTGRISDCARYAIGADEHCEQRTWPELVTVSALVGGVTCDVQQYRLTRGYNSYPWNSREAQYELSVAKGCGGAENGSTVTFTVNDDFVTTAAWMPGGWQMDLLPVLAGNSPSQQPTWEQIDSLISSAEEHWNATSDAIGALRGRWNTHTSSGIAFPDVALANIAKGQVSLAQAMVIRLRPLRSDPATRDTATSRYLEAAIAYWQSSASLYEAFDAYALAPIEAIALATRWPVVEAARVDVFAAFAEFERERCSIWRQQRYTNVDEACAEAGR